MQIHYKNVLAGVGSLAVLLLLITLGLVNFAYNPNEEAFSVASKDDTLNTDRICESKVYGVKTFSPDSPENQFASIFVDAKGNVYFVSSLFDKIKVYNRDGNFEKDIIGFDNPISVAVDSVGNTYVVDQHEFKGNLRNQVRRFTIAGNQEKLTLPPISIFQEFNGQKTSFTPFPHPYALSLDKNNNLYVINDENNNTIYTFGSVGTLPKMQWQTNEYNGGKFAGPKALAVGEYIYAVDAYANRVFKFSLDGKFIKEYGFSWQVGDPGDGIGGFNAPEGIAIDNNGNVFVADTGNDRIQKLDISTEKWSIYEVNGDSYFDSPNSIAFDGEVLYVNTFGGVKKIYKLCGRIIIEKNTVPDSMKSFTFFKDFLNKEQFSLVNGGKNTDKNIEVLEITSPIKKDQIFTITEAKYLDYKTVISCSDPSGGTDIYDSQAFVKLNHQKFEEVYCIFTNTLKTGTSSTRYQISE